MAAEVSGLPNGNYGMHQSYNAGADQGTFSYSASNQNSQPPAAQPAAPAASNTQQQQTPQPEIPKDEVGWYFVEQYYTTLSRTPEKLYLFYNKRSQFVSGQETDKVAVCVGQRAINDKIRDLDFNDCKVRVTNVDSQASDSNIVIQVIGELSNKGQPHKKFTQTFVLATQTNGYFVLNDIFRYLVEEVDEAEAETQQPQEEVQQVSGTENGTTEPAPIETHSTLPSSADSAAGANAAEVVDKKIEEKLVNGTKPEVEAEQKLAAEEKETPAPVEEKAVEEAPAQPEKEAEPAELEKINTAQADVEPETPKDPEPTRAPSPPKQEAAKPAAAPAPAPKPAAPAVPKTWASLAASAAAKIAPVVPQPVAQAAKTVQQKAAAAVPAAPAAAIAAAVTPNTPSAPSSQDAKGSDSQDEWTAVGSTHNRNASKQTNATPQQQEPQYRGYIKNVADTVEGPKLKAELEKFGEVLYFDIARQKNCAFVDFKTADGYNKAKSTQFEVEGNDVPLFVEERKFRPGSTPYIPRGQYQGGRGGARGGANQGTPRGNFQGGRGGQGQAAPRGRGGYASAGQRGGRGGAPA